MKKIMMVIALGMAGGFGAVSAPGQAFGTVADGGPPEPSDSGHRQSVSEDQYQVLIGQCRYIKTAGVRDACRSKVRDKYEIGEASETLDCRTYSGVTVCGELDLTATQKKCVQHSVDSGLSYRRSEVECYVAY